MLWYQYDPETREYTHKVRCQRHPLKDEYLIPPNATPEQPPKAGDKQVAVFTDNRWQIEEDHRGDTVYSMSDKTAMVITEIGPILEGYTTIKPAEHEYIHFFVNNGYARQNRINKQQVNKMKKQQKKINDYVLEQM